MGFVGDVFRIRATAIVILALVSAFARADLDYSADFYLRSYPLSGGVLGNAGYGILLWGKQEQKPAYGYVRPNVGVGTAGYYNLVNAAIDVYPISFFGFRAGGEAIENDRDLLPYDCSAYQCRGRMYRTFLQSELTLGAGKVFGQLRWRRDRWTRGNPETRAYIDSISGLALDGNGDAMTLMRGLVGYKLNDTWSVAGAYQYAQADNTRNVQHFPFALVRYAMAPYIFGFAAGVYSSTLKREGPALMLSIAWNGRSGVALAP